MLWAEYRKSCPGDWVIICVLYVLASNVPCLGSSAYCVNIYTLYIFLRGHCTSFVHIPHLVTVGATRLACATALARSLSNTNMEMFYTNFRLEISTDWNSAFIEQISIKKIWNLFLEVVQNSVWNYFSEISPFFFHHGSMGAADNF